MEVNAAQKFNVKVIPVLIDSCNFASSGEDKKGAVPVLYSYIDLQDISKIQMQIFLQNPLQYLPVLHEKVESHEDRLLERCAGQLTDLCQQYRKEAHIQYHYSAKTNDYSFILPVEGDGYPCSAEIGLQMQGNLLKGYVKVFASDTPWHDDIRKSAKKILFEGFADLLPEFTVTQNRSTLEFFSVDCTALKQSVCKDFSKMLDSVIGLTGNFFVSAVQHLQTFENQIGKMSHAKKILADSLCAVFGNDNAWRYYEDNKGGFHYVNTMIGNSYSESFIFFTGGNNDLFELAADIKCRTESILEITLQLKSKLIGLIPKLMAELREKFQDLSSQSFIFSDPESFCINVLPFTQDEPQQLFDILKQWKIFTANFFAQNGTSLLERLQKELYQSSDLFFENSIRRVISESKIANLQKYSEVSLNENKQIQLALKHPAIYFGTSDLFPILVKKDQNLYKITMDIADMPGVLPEYADYFKKHHESSVVLPSEISVETLLQKIEELHKKRQQDFFELYNRPVKNFCTAIHKMYEKLNLEEKNRSQDECYAARCNFSLGAKLPGGCLTVAVVSPGFGLWDMRVRLSGYSSFLRLNDEVKSFLFNHLQREACKQGIECEFIRQNDNLISFDMKLPDGLKNFLPLCEGQYRDIKRFCDAAEQRIRLLLANSELMQAMFIG